MKNAKKNPGKKKRKIIVVLVVMVSLVFRSGMVSDEEGTCLSII